MNEHEIGAAKLYEAYGAHTGNLNYQGLPMPAWEALPEKIRGAWREVSRKAKEMYGAEAAP